MSTMKLPGLTSARQAKSPLCSDTVFTTLIDYGPEGNFPRMASPGPLGHKSFAQLFDAPRRKPYMNGDGRLRRRLPLRDY
jgi:hypothetical protein